MPAPQAAPAPKALSAAEQALIKLQARAQILSALGAYCRVEFPATGQAYQDALVAWMGPRRAALGDADRLKRRRVSANDDGAIVALEFGERSGMEVWQTQQLGISSNERPSAADCMKLAQGIRGLSPEPAHQ